MRHFLLPALQVCALAAALACAAQGQTPTPAPAAQPPAPLDDVRQQLQQQGAEIERLRAALKEQTDMLQQLLAREAAAVPAPASVTPVTYKTSDVPTIGAAGATATSDQPAPQSGAGGQAGGANAQPAPAAAPRATEITTGVLSSLSFSGDFRLRYEGQFGQLNALANSANPAVVGNELAARNRARLRLRFAVAGKFGDSVMPEADRQKNCVGEKTRLDEDLKRRCGEREFQWGFRLATGTYPDIISTNQTLTDVFTRKAFGIDQAFITYNSTRLRGLRLQAGKFDRPWDATEMTFDVDLMPEGLNEQYSHDFKSSWFKNLTLIAWQLPFLERASGFVLGADGRVSVDQSRRAGRDLALYGAEARGRFDLTPQTRLTLSAADHYFSGTQFVTVAQLFGAQLQIPVTINIPATATTPAQTVTTTVSIPRDALVGGANTGASTTNTNAVNRDGRLSSGFNLVDVIGRLDFKQIRRYPVALLFDFVRNTQAHDVVTAGANGANRLLANHEDSGYWAEVRVCRLQAEVKPLTCDSLDRRDSLRPGDLSFGYTFLRIEKDAVLTGFNFSDILQPSDVRVHRLAFTYTVDPRVLLSLTEIISQRPNGLLGPFGATPPGSLNRATHRLQFDTVFRF